MKKEANPRKINFIVSFMSSKDVPNKVLFFSFWVIGGYKSSSI